VRPGGIERSVMVARYAARTVVAEDPCDVSEAMVTKPAREWEAEGAWMTALFAEAKMDGKSAGSPHPEPLIWKAKKASRSV